MTAGVAIVCGGSRGICVAIGSRLAPDGFDVFLEKCAVFGKAASDPIRPLRP
jgi:NAD(P)-dependent dehydrogenase (short-subunit alcohol dehydrogenase family)